MKRIATASALVVLAVVLTACDAHHAHGSHRAADTASFVVVASVVPGGPAAKAGLQAGDELVRFAGETIATDTALERIMGRHRSGDTVPLTVTRGGQTVDLELTFGERPGGGVSVGASLSFSAKENGDDPSDPDAGTAECLAWIDTTYRVDSLNRELGLELVGDYREILKCVKRDTDRMGAASAVKYCDNVFKVHCSAVDLLMEIAEAQIERCQQRLGTSLGLDLTRYKSWNACAEQGLFDRYSIKGEPIDESVCRSALLDECGTNIDAVIESGEASTAQQAFAACCSADALDPECAMIDDTFARGPCRERSVCVNRETSEWFRCSILG